jgi:hypothetical protein
MVETDGATGAQTVEITRGESRVAAENASAVVCYALDVSGQELADVMTANRDVREPLLAPVSAR